VPVGVAVHDPALLGVVDGGDGVVQPSL